MTSQFHTFDCVAMSKDLGDIRIGTQGWNYDAWVGPFYPRETRPADFLTVYARAFKPSRSTLPSTRFLRRRPCADGPIARRPIFRSRSSCRRRSRTRTDCATRDLAALFFERARELGPEARAHFDATRSRLRAARSYLRWRTFCRSFRATFAWPWSSSQRGWIHDGIIALLAEHNVGVALVDARWIPRKAMMALAERPTSDVAYIRWMA